MTSRWAFGVVALAALAVVSCSNDGGTNDGNAGAGDAGAGDTGTGKAGDEVTSDDVVDLDDVLGDDIDAAGAVKVGDPAAVLTAVAKNLADQRKTLRAVVDRIKLVVVKAQPDKKGTTAAGQPFGVWSGTKDGVQYRFIVVRVAPKRLRYSLYGSTDGKTWKGLLTGVFVKKAKKKGGGRLHLNLSNITDLFPALNVDGRIHLWFANGGAVVKARRVRYRDVKRRKGQVGPAWNFGADYLRKIGTGGGARTLVVGDLDKKPATVEAFAARIGWLAGKGGRGVAAYGQVYPDKKLYAVLHECWGPAGKNKYVAAAWKDPNAPGKSGWTNGGDKTACLGDDPGEPGEALLDPSASDTDPDVEEALKLDGAKDIDEKGADAADDASLGDA